MLKLLKGAECFAPAYLGKKDLLISFGTICLIEDSIPGNLVSGMEVFDLKGSIICPAFIDQHVHITGGGGEEGPASRIPEIGLEDIVSAGVTTVVGILGTDGITRSVAGLMAKAMALEAQGLTTYIYTGSYGIPTSTLTGKPESDLVFVDKVIGVGEVAIADYRSSHPSLELIRALASQTRLGGMIGGKAGVMHIHVGDGREGLDVLKRLLGESDLPVEMFVPTHVNRNKRLFGQALEYAVSGGNIDLTAGMSSGKGISVREALAILVSAGVDLKKVTVSSDGNGSVHAAEGNGLGGKVAALADDIRKCMLDGKIGPEIAIRTVTSNVADVLKLSPGKGYLAPGSDADILVLDGSSLEIKKVFARGRLLFENGAAARE